MPADCGAYVHKGSCLHALPWHLCSLCMSDDHAAAANEHKLFACMMMMPFVRLVHAY